MPIGPSRPSYCIRRRPSTCGRPPAIWAPRASRMTPYWPCWSAAPRRCCKPPRQGPPGCWPTPRRWKSTASCRARISAATCPAAPRHPAGRDPGPHDRRRHPPRRRGRYRRRSGRRRPGLRPGGADGRSGGDGAAPMGRQRKPLPHRTLLPRLRRLAHRRPAAGGRCTGRPAANGPLRHRHLSHDAPQERHGPAGPQRSPCNRTTGGLQTLCAPRPM